MDRILVSLFLMLIAPLALAQRADVGLVNLVAGEVTYTPASGAPARVQSFMKLRDGDRIDVPAGGQVRVVFFEGARQERWTGPASFRAGRSAGEPLSGSAAEVVTLPAGAAQRIAQVPQLVQIAKLGGIQLRGMSPPPKAGADQPPEVRAARAAYEQMRADLPADDIAPELYLYAVLNDYQLYGEMKAVAGEMLRKQPGNEDVQQLLAWVNSRLSR
jgi:hypothetical protein